MMGPGGAPVRVEMLAGSAAGGIWRWCGWQGIESG